MSWSSNQQQQEYQLASERQQYLLLQQQQLQNQNRKDNAFSYSCNQVAGSSNFMSSNQLLPKEVYRKLRQVDQQPSALAAAHLRSGCSEFSARILDKREYKVGKNAYDVTIVQLVEIIKKPGQSLGLYLREGNGIDRFTGVFASRFGENSELERFGDIIRPSDEILNVNNVEVTGMSIDDVVLMLSIPRRLLLRIKYFKNRRDAMGSTVATMSDEIRNAEQRPVVVFQKSVPEERYHPQHSQQSIAEGKAGLGCAPTAGILTKPACTASTWLGKKVRQQQRQQQVDIHYLHEPDQPVLDNRSMIAYPTVSSSVNSGSISSNSLPTARQYYYVAHQPRVSDLNGKLVSNKAPYYGPDAQNMTRYPLSEQLGVRRRHPAFSSVTLDRFPMAANMNSSVINTSMTPTHRALTTVGSPNFARYNPVCETSSSAHSTIEAPTINQTAFNQEKNNIVRSTTSQTNYTQPNFLQHQQQRWQRPYDLSYSEEKKVVTPYFFKSNSLPRRKIQSAVTAGTLPRSVKWRNNLISGGVSNVFSNMPDTIESRLAKKNFKSFRRSGYNATISGGGRRTIADIFSAQEYKNWAVGDETMSEIGTVGHRSRIFGSNGNASVRSISLPSKTIFQNNIFLNTKPQQPWSMASMSTSVSGSLPLSNSQYFKQLQPIDLLQSKGRVLLPPKQVNDLDKSQASAFLLDYMSDAKRADILDRLHVSPLMNRKAPLRTVGSGFDVDRLSLSALNGILSVSIVEGKNLKVPDRMHSKQLYVVLEINEVHRARTGISVPEQNFYWNEKFEIDVQNVTDAQFFVYAWHPQLRHKFCHKGSMCLLDAFFVNQLNGNGIFTLNMEPSGHLLIRIGFADMAQAYCRNNYSTPASSVFGVSLDSLIQRDKLETPIALLRLIHEIEERGADTPGLYYLCGAVERKLVLRKALECDSFNADLSTGPVPDVNLLTCLVKDFLRELNQPLISTNIYTMLVDASSVLNVANDKEDNQKFILRIIDCLPTANKNTLILVMDHLRTLLASEPHNGLTVSKLSSIFGPLIFCTANLQQISIPTTPESNKTETSSKSGVKVNLLSVQQAAQSLKLLLEFWPTRVNSSNSNSSSNSP